MMMVGRVRIIMGIKGVSTRRRQHLRGPMGKTLEPGLREPGQKEQVLT